MKATFRQVRSAQRWAVGAAVLWLSGCFVSTTGSFVERGEPDAMAMDGAVDGMAPPDGRIMDAAVDASLDATVDSILIPDADGAATWVPPEGWWNADWRRRYGVAIDTSGLARALNDVPVMIELRPDRVDYELAGEGGASLRFVVPTDGGGQELDFEIERWDPTGSSVLWVRVPVLTIGDRFRLYVYLDNPEAAARAGMGWVWDREFRGVWHMNERFEDASEYENDGRGAGPTDEEGRLAGGLHFESESLGVVDDDSSLDLESAVTISAGVRPEGDARHRGILAKRASCGDSANYALAITGGGGLFFEYHSDGWQTWSGGSVSADEWTHVAAVMHDTDNRLILYVNGVAVRTDSSASRPLRSDTNPIEIGRNGGCAGDFFEGGLDEIRLSAEPRSGAWIWFEHHMVQPGAILFEPAEGEGV